MSEIINKLNDEALDPTVKITDTEGVTAVYDFLDIIFHDNKEYIVLTPHDGDGYIDIFAVITEKGKEVYQPVTDEKLCDELFEIFKIKNEDEFDFV